MNEKLILTLFSSIEGLLSGAHKMEVVVIGNSFSLVFFLTNQIFGFSMHDYGKVSESQLVLHFFPPQSNVGVQM